MTQQRILSIFLGATSGGVLALVLSGARLSWTTALMGAALVAAIEYAVGDIRRIRTDSRTADAAGQPVAELQPDNGPTNRDEPESTAAAAWNQTAMVSLPIPAAMAATKPTFTRRPLDAYVSAQPRTAQQCPTCASHTISGVGTSFQCHQCTAIWTWQTGEHWPDVRPQPNLQEITHVSETS